MRKIVKSHIYSVDQDGNLIRNYTSAERFWNRIHELFISFPSVVSFMLTALFVMEVVCLIGLCQSVFSTAHHTNLEAYLFLAFVIGVMCVVGFVAGCVLAERQAADELSLYRKKTTNRSQN